MITKIAMVPGILVIGLGSYFLHLDIWVTLVVGLAVAVVVLVADAIFERRKRRAKPAATHNNRTES